MPRSFTSHALGAGRAAIVLMLLVWPIDASAARSVLTLYWDGRDAAVNAAFEEGLDGVLRSDSGGDVESYVAYVDPNRFPADAQPAELCDYLRSKYTDKKIDVIVAATASALDFLVSNRATLFPAVPIVYFTYGPPVIDAERVIPGLTGVVAMAAFGRTIELARGLHPDLKQVFVVITSAGDRDRSLETVVREELASVHSGLQIEYLVDRKTDELLNVLHLAPPHSIVLYVRHSQDAPDKPLAPADALSLIARSSSVPIYGVAAPYVGRGLVGGYTADLASVGAQVGELALRIASGVAADQIPVASASLTPVFDWRQLQRWHIVESRLPAGSSIQFRPVGSSRRDLPRDVATGALILMLTVLTGGLLFEHRRRSRAEIEARRYLATMAHLDRRAAMGELATSLAHELNQPLAAILRNAEAAKMQLASGAPPIQELQEIVEDIRKDDKRAGELIRRMRTLLQRRDLDAQTIDLNVVVQETVDLLGPEAAAKGVRVEIESGAGQHLVNGDRVHLQQVLLNVVLNGMDAMAGVPPERRRLTIRTARVAGEIEVAVSDTGCGIADDALARIFDPFFTTKGEGMGMGLSISRSIIEAHDGRILAENNRDRGATIRVFLPVRPAERDTAHVAPSHS